MCNPVSGHAGSPRLAVDARAWQHRHMTFTAAILAFALAAPAPTGPTPRVETDAVAAVKAFYERDTIRAYEFYSARLKDLFIDDQRPGQAGNLDFAFHVNAQDREDGWEKTLTFNLIAPGTDRAVVRVTFRNFRPQDLHYTMVRERGRWVIDDVKSVAAEGWVLSDILERGR